MPESRGTDLPDAYYNRQGVSDRSEWYNTKDGKTFDYRHPNLPAPAAGAVDPNIRRSVDAIHPAIKSRNPKFSESQRKDAAIALQRQAFYDKVNSEASRTGMHGAIDSMLAANSGPSMAALQGQQAREQNAQAFGPMRGNAGFQNAVGELGRADSGIAGDTGRAQLAEMYGNLNGAAAGTNAMRAQDIQQAQGQVGTELGQKERNLERYTSSGSLGSKAADADRQANTEGYRLYQTGRAQQLEKNAQDAQRAFDTTATVVNTVSSVISALKLF